MAAEESEKAASSIEPVLNCQDACVDQIATMSLLSDEALLRDAAQFLLSVAARLDLAIKDIQTKRERPGGHTWQWSIADDTTATATQGPLWAARELLSNGLASTAAGVERMHQDLCALLCVRHSLTATAVSIASRHPFAAVRGLAEGIVEAQTCEELPSFDQIQNSVEESEEQSVPDNAAEFNLPFQEDTSAQGYQRVQQLRAELGEVLEQLQAKTKDACELSEKLRMTGHECEAQQVDRLIEEIPFQPSESISDFQRWTLLSHVATLTDAVSKALFKVSRSADGAVLAQAVEHLQKGKEIDWDLTTKQLGMLKKQLYLEGSTEAAHEVEVLQQVSSGVGMWLGEQGKWEREQLQKALTGCAELAQLLHARGHEQLAPAVQALSTARSFSREKAAQARELARACLNVGTVVGDHELSIPTDSPLKFVLLHDESHHAVHSGLSSPFLESSAFLDRARHELQSRIDAREYATSESTVALPSHHPEDLTCNYTPRDFGTEVARVPPVSSVSGWVPQSPRTSFGAEVAGVIERLQMEGSDAVNIFQRNERLQHRMSGLQGRISEIEHYITDGSIVKMDALNQGIDRVSERLVSDIEEREHMEAEVNDMRQRMDALKAKLKEIKESEPSQEEGNDQVEDSGAEPTGAIPLDSVEESRAN